MGRRGPAKTPTALANLRGDPGHRKKNRREPKPKASSPKDIPQSLDAVGRREWTRISKELHRLGLLTVVDRSALESVCHAYSKFILLEAQIAEIRKRMAARERSLAKQPTLVKMDQAPQEPSKEQIADSERLSRAMSLSIKCHQLYRSLANEFGLTPSARVRLQCPDPKQPGDPDGETGDLQDFVSKRPHTSPWDAPHASC